MRVGSLSKIFFILFVHVQEIVLFCFSNLFLLVHKYYSSSKVVYVVNINKYYPSEHMT